MGTPLPKSRSMSSNCTPFVSGIKSQAKMIARTVQQPKNRNVPYVMLGSLVSDTVTIPRRPETHLNTMCGRLYTTMNCVNHCQQMQSVTPRVLTLVGMTSDVNNQGMPFHERP